MVLVLPRSFYVTVARIYNMKLFFVRNAQLDTLDYCSVLLLHTDEL